MRHPDPHSVESATNGDAEPSDRRGKILDGARSAFLRFGFERSSIADIAAGAGVSRTAVYHYFPGKEDVLQAVVGELHAKALTTAQQVLDRGGSEKTVLTGLLQAKFGPSLAIMAASPHGRELVDAGNRLTGAATLAADDAFQALVVDALARHGRSDDPTAVAETLIAAAKGLMGSGDRQVTSEEFEARLDRLTDWATS